MGHATRPRAERNGWSVVVLSLTAQSDVSKWVLHDRLEDVRRLHADLLGEAPVGRAGGTSRLRLHIEFVDDDFEDVELFDFEITE